jgi:hypothetical protein
LTLENKAIGEYGIKIQTKDFKTLRLVIKSTELGLYNILSDMLNKKSLEKYFEFAIKFNKNNSQGDEIGWGIYDMDKEYSRQGVDYQSEVISF